jgi:hypothetical protein
MRSVNVVLLAEQRIKDIYRSKPKLHSRFQHLSGAIAAAAKRFKSIEAF